MPPPAATRRAAPPPLLTRPFLLLVVGHFLQALGYASMLLLPLYLQHLGASRTEIGVLMATAGLSGLATRPLVGWALDRWGRKPTVVLGTLIMVTATTLVLAVDRVGPLIYLERVIFGVAEGVLFTSYFTFAADVVPASRRTEGLALFGISGLVPLLVNPLSDALAITPSELRWFLPAVGGFIGLSLVPVLLLPAGNPVEQGAPRMREALTALRRRPLWSVWVATAAFSALVALFMAFATVAAERRGVGRPATLWLSYAAGAVTVRALGAKLPDRVRPANVVAPAMGLYVAAMVLASAVGSLGGFLVAALLAGVGHGYCFPVLTAQVVSRSPATFRGSAMAFFTALWGLSELAVSPLFGAVADRWGDGAMFLLAAAMGIGGLVVWALLEHRSGAGVAPAVAAGAAGARQGQ